MSRSWRGLVEAHGTEFAYALHPTSFSSPGHVSSRHWDAPDTTRIRALAFLVLISCETSGGATRQPRHLVALQLDLFYSLSYLGTFLSGGGIKTSFLVLQSPPALTTTWTVHHTCVSTTTLCVPWGKYLQRVLSGFYFLLLLFFHLGILGFGHPFTIADAWELIINY